MKNLGIRLTWIAVRDWEAALDFYTKTAGFTVLEKSVEYKWAELSGEGGQRLGIAQVGPESMIQPGTGGIITVTVDNLETAIDVFQSKGAKLLGKIEEIPGHVKIQTFADPEGNFLQLVELLTQ